LDFTVKESGWGVFNPLDRRGENQVGRGRVGQEGGDNQLQPGLIKAQKTKKKRREKKKIQERPGGSNILMSFSKAGKNFLKRWSRTQETWGGGGRSGIIEGVGGVRVGWGVFV